MSRVSILLAVVVLVGFGLALPATAAADDQETSSELEISDATTITDYQLEDGELSLTVETDDRVHVEIQDSLAGIDQDGAVEPNEADFDVLPGEETITMDLTDHYGAHTAGVTINGETVRLSSSMDDDPASDAGENPFHYFGGESGLFSGILGTIGLAALAALFVVKREQTGVVKA